MSYTEEPDFLTLSYRSLAREALHLLHRGGYGSYVAAVLGGVVVSFSVFCITEINLCNEPENGGNFQQTFSTSNGHSVEADYESCDRKRNLRIACYLLRLGFLSGSCFVFHGPLCVVTFSQSGEAPFIGTITLFSVCTFPPNQVT